VARINVEDGLFIDQRWLDLVVKLQNADTALGALVRAWRVAQDYWKQNSNGIPKAVWKAQRLNDTIIEVGLAEDLGEFVKIWNSEKHFAWVRQKVEAGKAGGKKSGTARSKTIKENQKRNEAGLSAVKRSEPSSSSSLSFSEKTKNTFLTESVAQASPPAQLPLPGEPKGQKFADTTRAKMRTFIAAYAEGYQAKYGGPPEGIRGNKALIGKIGHWIESVSEDRAISLVQVFLQIDHRPIAESQHDLWQFFRHLNRIGNALATGQDGNSINWNKVFAGVA
jgi:hypothetical protein